MLWSAYSSASSEVIWSRSMRSLRIFCLLYTASGIRSAPPFGCGCQISVCPMQAASSPSANSASGFASSR